MAENTEGQTNYQDRMWSRESDRSSALPKGKPSFHNSIVIFELWTLVLSPSVSSKAVSSKGARPI